MRVMKNLKTYERLVKKANSGTYDNTRMPNLNKVSELLTELGIKNTCMNWSETKWSSASGYRYHTSGGSRDYNGYRLSVPEIKMSIISTQTYYSWNTRGYAKELVKLIERVKF